MVDPTTSVIIPCFERPQLLARALSSVLRQTDPDLEVIVGDDGSTKDLFAVAESFHDGRIRVVRREENGGIGAARNLAAASARGLLVAYLDSDDEWHPQHLDTARRGIGVAGEHVSAVTTGFEMRYPSGRVDVRVPKQHKDLVARIVRGVDLSAGSTMLVRRSALDDIGPWPEDIPRNEDYDWFLRMAVRGHQLVVVPKVTVIIHADDRSPLDREALARSHRILLERHRPWLAAQGALERHLRAKLNEEMAWADWRCGDLASCARHLSVAIALDPLARGRKLARSALRRSRYRAS